MADITPTQYTQSIKDLITYIKNFEVHEYRNFVSILKSLPNSKEVSCEEDDRDYVLSILERVNLGKFNTTHFEFHTLDSYGPTIHMIIESLKVYIKSL